MQARVINATEYEEEWVKYQSIRNVQRELRIREGQWTAACVAVEGHERNLRRARLQLHTFKQQHRIP